jgi:hypothetical protein
VHGAASVSAVGYQLPAWDAAVLQPIVPANGGLTLDPTLHERVSRRLGYLEWPQRWEMQLVLGQGAHGGVVVRALDPAGVFPKALRVRRERDRHRLDLVTIARPGRAVGGDGGTGFAGVPWHLNVYAGAWTGPASDYQQQLARAGYVEARAKGPAWTEAIDLVVILPRLRRSSGGPLDLPALEALITKLSKQVQPARTLLYVPNWRAPEYDYDYPVYEAADGFATFVATAHAAGFRVMAHVSLQGCAPAQRLCAPFAGDFLHDADTGEDLAWQRRPPRAQALGLPALDYRFVDLRAPAWEALITTTLRTLRDREGVDAVHLDAPRLGAASGRRGGERTGVQVFNDVMARLRDAVPDLALSVEGMNEVTVRYADFVQRPAPLGGDPVVDASYVDHLHSLEGFVFRRFARPYAHLDLVGLRQETRADHWRQVIARAGGIATLGRPSAADLTTPLFVRFFDELRRWTSLSPVPDFAGDWTRDGLWFRYRAKGGMTLVVESSGLTLVPAVTQQEADPADPPEPRRRT